MIVIGLTGGIGMGKSTTAELFRQEGLPVWDADAAVHRLYAPGSDGAKEVLNAFPDADDGQGGVDRHKLAVSVLNDAEKFSHLETIIHPLVQGDRQRFLKACSDAKADIVLCDIPLLFEGEGPGTVDVVVVVTAPEEVRRVRVLERPGMTMDKYEAIVARQVPEDIKLARADYEIHTDRGVEWARAQVRAVLTDIRENRLPSVRGIN